MNSRMKLLLISNRGPIIQLTRLFFVIPISIPRMKFSFLLFIFGCLHSGVVTAQLSEENVFGDKQHRFEGRLIFGGSITQVDGDTYSGFHKIGIHAGPSVYVRFNDALGISMDILYTQRGTRGAHVNESYSVGTYFDKYYLNLNYTEIPVTLHLNGGMFDYEAGLSYARLVKSKEWAEADVPIYINPALAYFNKYDVNYIAGITVRINRHWYGSARFQYSALTIRTWDRVYPRYGSIGANQYNNVAVFRLIYKL
jgi:Outer membrane protein beta-barrel domain